MIFNLTSGGASSGGLNFNVVGGTSAPSSPGDNTIWINTSTSITGWAMQGEAPSGSEGLVWIKTALSGTTAFNALKKNAIQIAVTGCQQYVSGAWANVAAQIWQNSAWVEFSTENLVLFEAGGSGSSKWTNSGWSYTQGGSYKVSGGTVGDDALAVTATYGRDYVVVGTAETYDLSNYSNLHVEYTFTSGGVGEVRVCTGLDLNTTVKSQTQITSGTSLDLDISSLSGAHYIVFDAAGSNSYGYNGVLTVTNVYLV